jgi:hypothetical protein
MIEIKTLKDVQRLGENPSLSMFYKSLVAEYVTHLIQAFCTDERKEDFSLQSHGRLVVLDTKEDVQLLFNRNFLMVEFVEIHQCNEETIFQANILEANDFMLVLFVSEELLSSTLRNWLCEYVEEP